MLGALRLAWQVGRDRPAVLAVFGYRGPVRTLLFLMARVLGIPVVTRSDANAAALAAESWWKRTLRALGVRLLVPARSRVWAIGWANETYWRDYLRRHNIVRIPYEVPVLPGDATPAARTSDPRRLRLLFVGRLVPVKGLGTVLDAFARLDGPEFAGWRLDVVGDGPLRPVVEAAAAADPRIQVHGSCEYTALGRYYAAADVLVLPSSYEPWGLVVNEALGFGLWTVVSDQVGARELITGPEEGAVFPAGDGAALASALRAARDHLRREPRPPATDTAELMARDLLLLGAVEAPA